MVGEEDADQFSDATIAAQGRANVCKIHLATEVCQHPGRAAIFFMDSIFIGDVPDVQPQVLQVAKLNAGRVPGIDLNDIIQEGYLLTVEGRVVRVHVAYAALIFCNNQCMCKDGRCRRVNPDLRKDRLLDL